MRYSKLVVVLCHDIPDQLTSPIPAQWCFAGGEDVGKAWGARGRVGRIDFSNGRRTRGFSVRGKRRVHRNYNTYSYAHCDHKTTRPGMYLLTHYTHISYLRLYASGNNGDTDANDGRPPVTVWAKSLTPEHSANPACRATAKCAAGS